MKNLKIKQVKFYQGVMVNSTNNQTSSQVVTSRSAQFKNLVSIEKSENGVLITTTDSAGRVDYTEVPYNNLAYINYEPEVEAKEDSEQKSAKSPSVVKPKPASSEPK